MISTLTRVSCKTYIKIESTELKGKFLIFRLKLLFFAIEFFFWLTSHVIARCTGS